MYAHAGAASLTIATGCMCVCACMCVPVCVWCAVSPMCCVYVSDSAGHCAMCLLAVCFHGHVNVGVPPEVYAVS